MNSVMALKAGWKKDENLLNSGTRIQIFIFGLVVFSILEFFISYRKRELKRVNRWPHNFLIIFIGSIAGKLIFPAGLGVVTTFSKSLGSGFFNLVDSNVCDSWIFKQLKYLLPKCEKAWPTLYFNSHRFFTHSKHIFRTHFA